MGRVSRFVNSPTGRRAIAWLAPIIVGWVVSKLQKPTSGGAGRKRVKNKAK